jgi:deoxyhypusine synthase
MESKSQPSNSPNEVITEKAIKDIENFLNKKYPVEEMNEQDFIKLKGYDFNQGLNYPNIISSFASTGLQASNLSQAISLVKEMIKLRSEGTC